MMVCVKTSLFLAHPPLPPRVYLVSRVSVFGGVGWTRSLVQLTKNAQYTFASSVICYCVCLSLHHSISLSTCNQFTSSILIYRFNCTMLLLSFDHSTRQPLQRFLPQLSLLSP